MKKFVWILALALVSLPASAQRDGNFWQPYEAAPHASLCNPTMIAEASGMIHVTTFATPDATGRLHFTYNFNLKGVGLLSQNDVPIATFRVQVNENYREVDLPALTDPIDISDTYRMRIEVTKGGPALNYYEKYTFRYHITPDGTVAVSLERYELDCK